MPSALAIWKDCPLRHLRFPARTWYTKRGLKPFCRAHSATQVPLSKNSRLGELAALERTSGMFLTCSMGEKEWDFNGLAFKPTFVLLQRFEFKANEIGLVFAASTS